MSHHATDRVSGPREVRPIRTEYRGTLFRSRLEARWALFFDTLGVRWEFEPEGYELPSGRYLPDFWLPDIGPNGAWFEVKGTEPTSDEQAILQELAEAMDVRAYIAFGMMPHPYDVARGWEIPHFDILAIRYWDNFQAFTVCDRCSIIGIEYMGRGARACECWPDEDKHYAYDHPRILAAYEAARTYSFWEPK